jgi:HlyD family secretion protein
MNDNKSTPTHRKRTLRRWISRIALGAVALGVVAAIITASLPKPVIVEIAAAQRGSLTVTIDEDGRTRVKDRYVISAPLAGSLARIELQPGDRVEAGAVVAHLLPLPAPLLDPRSQAQSRARLAAAEAASRQAQAAESRARAAMEFAESEIESQRRLAARGSIPQQRLDRAELELRTKREDLASATFGVRVARHQVDMARAALGRLDRGAQAGDQGSQMMLKSPVAGVVLEVLREHEGVVQAGTPLLEIGNPTALEIVVDVLTTDAVRIQPGVKARIIRWGGQQELDAHVRRIEPKAFSRMSSLGVQEQRVNVVLDLDSPQESWTSLGDGYRIEANIAVWEADDVMRIPVSAVFKHDEKWTVFVVDGEAARIQHVEIGERNGLQVQILAGLAPGQRVILHPGERVADGATVKPR